MRRSYSLYLRHALLPVLIIFLGGILISRWQVKSQTSSNPTQESNGNKVSELIQNLKNSGAQFPEVNLADQEMNLIQAMPMSQITNAKAFDLNYTALSMMASEQSQTLTLKVPDPNIFGLGVSLELTRVNILAEGFQAKRASDGQPVDVKPASHYRGSVRGIPGSLAVINVSENEVSGFYSLPDEGNFVVGKLKNTTTNQHVVIPESELPKPEQSYTCETKDDAVSIPLQNETDQNTSAIIPGVPCVKVYVEADHDLYINKNSSAQQVVSYMMDVFSKSAAIYERDGINIQLSGILVWDTPSPYTGINTSSGLLKKFQEVTSSRPSPFNGDIGHLVALRGGGGVAYVDRLCKGSYNLAFSGINPTAEIVNDYSWTVSVFTHEMGHVMGSRHTHACVWNGNNTAIDGCYATEPRSPEEQPCARPGLPAKGGGTIMSYCHLLPDSVGINFANGFGPQPAALILDRISKANCLTECSTGTTCTYSIDHPNNNFPSAGGADTISVTSNVGCAWSATSNATWIKILSGSNSVGNVPVSILVGANSSTVSRTGTATIAGLTFTVNQDPYTPGSELITNGNFQYTTGFWTFTGNALLQLGDYPHTGSAYVILSRFNYELGTVYQDITIPSGTSPNLTFWLNISSQEISTTIYDSSSVWVEIPNTTSTKVLDSFGNIDKGTPGSYVQKGPYNLNEFAGQTIRIRFRATNDKNLYTAFRVADVSVR